MPDADGNIDPPWRLDPTINIINMSWTPSQHILVGGAIDGVAALFGSQDGKEWYRVPAPEGGVVRELAYGDGAWIAFVANPTSRVNLGDFIVFKSKDHCKTWKKVVSLDNQNSCLLYGKPDKKSKKGVFVSLPTSAGAIAYSKDGGDTWPTTGIISGDPDFLKSVSLSFADYEDKKNSPVRGEFFITFWPTGDRDSPWEDDFFGPGNIPNPDPVVMRSKDGVSWSGGSTWTGPGIWPTFDPEGDLGGEAFGPIIPGPIAYQNGRYVMVGFAASEDWAVVCSGTSGDGIAYSGPDPIEAPIETNLRDTESTTTNDFLDPGRAAIAAGNGKFVWLVYARGVFESNIPSEAYAGIATSGGGGGWSIERVLTYDPTGFRSMVWQGVRYNKKLKMFVAIGDDQDGTNLTVDGTIWTSKSEGGGWTRVSNPFSNSSFYGATTCLAFGPIVARKNANN